MSAFTSRMGLRRVAAGLLAAGWLMGWAWQAHAQDSKEIDDLMRQAQTELQKGKPRDAENTLRKAIEMAPARGELYMLRSRARDSSGKFDAALEDANKYIQLEPNDPYAYINRSRIHVSMEKPELALADANKAIELDPQEPDGYYRRSDIYRQMGKKAESEADEVKAEQLAGAQ